MFSFRQVEQRYIFTLNTSNVTNIIKHFIQYDLVSEGKYYFYILKSQFPAMIQLLDNNQFIPNISEHEAEKLFRRYESYAKYIIEVNQWNGKVFKKENIKFDKMSYKDGHMIIKKEIDDHQINYYKNNLILSIIGIPKLNHSRFHPFIGHISYKEQSDNKMTIYLKGDYKGYARIKVVKNVLQKIKIVFPILNMGHV